MTTYFSSRRSFSFIVSNPIIVFRREVVLFHYKLFELSSREQMLAIYELDLITSLLHALCLGGCEPSEKYNTKR